MGRVIFGLVIGAIAFAVGLSMFPSIKNILGGNSTTGFSYLLAAGYSSLKYILVFFIFFAVYLAIKRRR